MSKRKKKKRVEEERSGAWYRSRCAEIEREAWKKPAKKTKADNVTATVDHGEALNELQRMHGVLKAMKSVPGTEAFSLMASIAGVMGQWPRINPERLLVIGQRFAALTGMQRPVVRTEAVRKPQEPRKSCGLTPSRPKRPKTPGHVTIEVTLIRQVSKSGKAFQVYLDDVHLEWLPKSQIAHANDYKPGDWYVEMEITRWLAEQKGLE